MNHMEHELFLVIGRCSLKILVQIQEQFKNNKEDDADGRTCVVLTFIYRF